MSFTVTFDERITGGSVRLRLPDMTTERFLEFANRNEGLKIEMNRYGEVIAFSPTGGGGGFSNTKLTRFLDEWTDTDGTGVAFDSSTLFVLPNGAKRSPDGAWILKTRWDALTPDEQEKPVPFAPDFAAEILSPSDSLSETQTKMEEYLAGGTRLGWLIDRGKRKVYVYRPGRDVETLDDPVSVSGDPELPGFTLNMSRIFLRRVP